MSRFTYVFFFMLFFFCVGCTPSSSDSLVTSTPSGWSAPVAISSLAPVSDGRSWEDKADAAMKIAEQEFDLEAKKAAAPITVIKLKAVKSAPKSKRLARAYRNGKSRQAHKKAKLKGNLALK